jgi:hypothetical protein
MKYELKTLSKVTANGSTYPIGHAMIWQPDCNLKLKLIVSEAALERDFVEIPFSNMKKYQKPGIKPEPHPGDSIREAVEKFPGGLAYFNAGELGMLNFPIVIDGTLITKPKPVKALSQKRWEPLNEEYTFFIQYPIGETKIKNLSIKNNQLISPLPGGTCGFSAPYIVKAGKHIPLKNPSPGVTPNSQEVLYPGGHTQAPICAMGITKDHEVVRVSLIGDLDNPNLVEHQPTEYDLVHYLQELNVVDALYAGASADVQYYDRTTGILGIGPERAKSAEAKWVLKEGQTERGLAVIGVLWNHTQNSN